MTIGLRKCLVLDIVNFERGREVGTTASKVAVGIAIVFSEHGSLLFVVPVYDKIGYSVFAQQ